MVNDKEYIRKEFDRFLTQQARKQGCHDDEVIDVIRDYIVNGTAV